jgi:hypothetical protein
MNNVRANNENIVIRVPNLPLLVDSLSTVILKVYDHLKEVKFLENPWLFEAHLKIKDREELESALVNRLESGIRKYREMKVVPVTVGSSGDTAKFGNLFKELGLQFAEGKVYEKFEKLCGALLSKYKGRILDLLSSEWDVDVSKFKVEIKLKGMPRKLLKLPSIIRSINVYEMGRFSGLRDVKPKGSASKALFDVRADLNWWLLSHILLTISMTHLERFQRGRTLEEILTYVHFEPIRGIRYSYIDLKCYLEIFEAIEENVKKNGLFVEDPEFARLSLILWAYHKASSPFTYAKIGGNLKIRRIKLAGQRMQETYIETLPAGEITLLDARLGQMFGENALTIAEKTAKLANMLQRLIREYEKIASELKLMRLAVLYKSFLRSFTEPGYATTSELLYEIQRFLETEDWRNRFIGVLTTQLKREGFKDDEAQNEVYKILDIIKGIMAEVTSKII